MSDKIDISAKADANTGMCVDPTSELGLRISTLYEGWNFNSGNYLFTTDTK